MISAGVIGFPVKHSRSPLIHTFWLKQLGIEGRYGKKEVPPGDLKTFLRGLPASGWAGCNVTLPYKEEACRHVDVLDERVKRIASLNTIYLREGKTFATSTDGRGFTENIFWKVPDFRFAGKTVVVLGAGGSSRAVIDEVLREDAVKVVIANRTPARAQALVQLFGARTSAISLDRIEDYLPTCHLLVNTTSAGIANDGGLDLSFDRLAAGAIVSDINYVPLVTPFLQRAEAAGHAIVPGLGMLLHQAVPGFELWFGRRPSVTQDLYDLVAGDIDPGYKR